MSVSGSYFLQQIQSLKLEKIQRLEELRNLSDISSGRHQQVYGLMLAINAEIANKHFKEVNSDLTLPYRIGSSVSLMVGLL